MSEQQLPPGLPVPETLQTYLENRQPTVKQMLAMSGNLYPVLTGKSTAAMQSFSPTPPAELEQWAKLMEQRIVVNQFKVPISIDSLCGSDQALGN
jgi:hypothetical protein